MGIIREAPNPRNTTKVVPSVNEDQEQAVQPPTRDNDPYDAIRRSNEHVERILAKKKEEEELHEYLKTLM